MITTNEVTNDSKMKGMTIREGASLASTFCNSDSEQNLQPGKAKHYRVQAKKPLFPPDYLCKHFFGYLFTFG
jgi:hypothetical protein